MTLTSTPPATSDGAHSRKPLTHTTRQRRRATTRSSVLMTALLFVVSLYFLGPVLWLLIASTKDTSELYASPGFWFGHHFQLWSQLRALFSVNGDIYRRWLANSILYSAGGAGIATLLSAGCGYAMAKYEFRGRELMFSVVLGGVLVPGTALAIPLYLLMSQVHLTNTYWSVLLPSIVSPFGVYLSRIYAVSAVPDELMDAMRMDGARDIRIFFTLGLRLMSPGLATVFLFQFVAIWNNFLLPLIMLSDQNKYPVTLGLFTWQSVVDHYPAYTGLTIIGSAVSVVPLALAFMTLQRFWRTDLSAGSVK
jgi:multiple sugar transport system permease protein